MRGTRRNRAPTRCAGQCVFNLRPASSGTSGSPAALKKMGPTPSIRTEIRPSQERAKYVQSCSQIRANRAAPSVRSTCALVSSSRADRAVLPRTGRRARNGTGTISNVCFVFRRCASARLQLLGSIENRVACISQHSRSDASQALPLKANSSSPRKDRQTRANGTAGSPRRSCAVRHRERLGLRSAKAPGSGGTSASKPSANEGPAPAAQWML